MAYTDYIDPGNSGGSVPTPDTKYLIKTGIVDPILTCDECKKTFNNEARFFEHKYTVHPIKSPLIIVKGEQIGHTKKRFLKKLAIDEIKIEHCTNVVVNENDKITPNQLIELLANQVSGFFKLDLVNKEYSRTYEIEFSVADQANLEAIDNSFIKNFQQNDLTPQKVSRFATEAIVYQNAKDYASAYVAYLYGVLAKEKNKDILTSITSYLDKFNESYEVLKHYNRPLARSVCSIISFNNNFFETTQDLGIHLPSILDVCVFIKNGNLSDSNSLPFSDSQLIPIDWITEKIIKISKHLLIHNYWLLLAPASLS